MQGVRSPRVSKGHVHDARLGGNQIPTKLSLAAVALPDGRASYTVALSAFQLDLAMLNVAGFTALR